MMNYYEEAKQRCPLCGAPMAEVDDPTGQDWGRGTDAWRWDVYRCTSPTCGIEWSYGDITGEGVDRTRVIEVNEGAPSAGLKLRIEWSMDELSPEGQVFARLSRGRRPFRKTPASIDIDVKATALVTGDRDRALREAFSLWRLRAFA